MKRLAGDDTGLFVFYYQMQFDYEQK